MFRSIRTLYDRLDEAHAVRRRQDLGRRRWLVSWSPVEDGGWRARVSCPEWPVTIERLGDTRRRAIARAGAVLDTCLEEDGAVRPVGPLRRRRRPLT